MVGDDIRNDVLAGQRAGLRGVFVLTGKHTRTTSSESAATSAEPACPTPWPDRLADVVAALD